MRTKLFWLRLECREQIDSSPPTGRLTTQPLPVGLLFFWMPHPRRCPLLGQQAHRLSLPVPPPLSRHRQPSIRPLISPRHRKARRATPRHRRAYRPRPFWRSCPLLRSVVRSTARRRPCRHLPRRHLRLVKMVSEAGIRKVVVRSKWVLPLPTPSLLRKSRALRLLSRRARLPLQSLLHCNLHQRHLSANLRLRLLLPAPKLRHPPHPLLLRRARGRHPRSQWSAPLQPNRQRSFHRSLSLLARQ